MPNAEENLGNGEEVPVAQRPAGLLPQTELSRLILFHGNGKDKTTPRAWAEMVDRHVTVLNWSNEQTAGAAIEAMREDANIWRQNLADHGDPDKRAVLKDWSKLKVKPGQRLMMMKGLLRYFQRWCQKTPRCPEWLRRRWRSRWTLMFV